MNCLTIGHDPSSACIFWLLLYTTQLSRGYFGAMYVQGLTKDWLPKLLLDIGKKVFFTHFLPHEAEGLIFSILIFPQSMLMWLVLADYK